MSMLQRPSPTTRPHDEPRGLCLPSCCKTPYFCARRYLCACHQSGVRS